MIKNKFSKVFRQSYVLASKSPRRIQLLNHIGLQFISIDSKTQELNIKNHNPVQLVKSNSLLKSRRVAINYNQEIIIGADTIVVLNKEILNKPADTKQAINFLKALSGNKHFVYTGVNVINTRTGKELFDFERTSVYFRKLDINEIKFYVDKYEPLDKAGAYGIQDDFGCLFIKKIAGDYYNIVGLPLVKLYEMLLTIV